MHGGGLPASIVGVHFAGSPVKGVSKDVCLALMFICCCDRLLFQGDQHACLGKCYVRVALADFAIELQPCPVCYLRLAELHCIQKRCRATRDTLGPKVACKDRGNSTRCHLSGAGGLAQERAWLAS